MDDEQLKLECLKVALDKGYAHKDATDEAQRIFNWIKGRSDDFVPPDVERVLRSAPAPKAKIVGTEGQLEPPFDDYLQE